jgi:hypothetical protein
MINGELTDRSSGDRIDAAAQLEVIQQTIVPARFGW